MARDPGLEDLLADDLAGTSGLTTRTMFGGLAWLWDGLLLCGARHDGLLVRLGAGRDGWALALPGIEPMTIRGRPMSGWVWAGDAACGDDAVRRRLLAAALVFVHTLPRRAPAPTGVPWDFPDTPDRFRAPAQTLPPKA